jgi:rare lipoprotein A (peptidoglycan hydrolase)
MSEKLLIVASTLAALLSQSQCAFGADLNLDKHGESKMRKLFDGVASFYAEKFHGRKTASGERFNMNALTCAHRTLPFGTKLMVKNARTGKSCVVRVNDRGPYSGARVLDLSPEAARRIGITGISRVICYAIKSAEQFAGPKLQAHGLIMAERKI